MGHPLPPAGAEVSGPRFVFTPLLPARSGDMMAHMRRVTMATVMCLIAALQVTAQTAPKASSHEVLKCAGLDGKACTWKQVADLSTAAVSAEGTPKALATLGKLTFASFDGTVKCEQTDGKSCTAEQVRSLNAVAAPLQLRLWYRFGGALDKR
jgi:hypothetical protein